MKALPHRTADLATAPPTDFDRPGDARSPEQLPLGAVAACFALTFRAIGRASGIECHR